MFCKNCGNEISNDAAVCVKCGVARGKGSAFCQNCGQPTAPNQAVCTSCGVALQTVPAGVEQKSKLVAGLLGIFLGTYGVHNFYLGRTTIAVIQLVTTIACILLAFCTFGLTAIIILGVWVWGLVEGIMILTGSIKVDGKGIPLKE